MPAGLLTDHDLVVGVKHFDRYGCARAGRKCRHRDANGIGHFGSMNFDCVARVHGIGGARANTVEPHQAGSNHARGLGARKFYAEFRGNENVKPHSPGR